MITGPKIPFKFDVTTEGGINLYETLGLTKKTANIPMDEITLKFNGKDVKLDEDGCFHKLIITKEGWRDLISGLLVEDGVLFVNSSCGIKRVIKVEAYAQINANEVNLSIQIEKIDGKLYSTTKEK